MLNHWLKTQAAAQAKRCNLNQALWAGRMLQYFSYRLRFFGLNTLLIFLVHVAEYLLLWQHIGHKHLIEIFAARSLSLLIQSGYWGYLESLRAQSRNLQRKGQLQMLGSVLNAWLSVNSIIAVGITLLFSGCFYQLTQTNNHHDPVLLILYGGIIAFELAASLITQTLHSGIYGVRRVYRPFWSIGAANFITLISVLTFWPLIHLYALPIAFALRSTFSLAFSWFFSQKTYHLMQLGALRWCPIGKARTDWQKSLGYQTIKNIFAAICMQLDGALLTLLLAWSYFHPHDYPWFFAIYLLSPLLTGCHNWPRLFYFDLMRLNTLAFSRMLHRLEHNLLVLALPISLGLTLVAGLSNFFILKLSIDSLLSMLIFLCLRSLAAQQQMRAFCRQKNAAIVTSGIAFSLIVFVMLNLTHNLSELFLGLASAQLVMLLMLHFYTRNQSSSASTHHSLYELLFQTASCRDRYYALQLTPRQQHYQKKLIKHLQQYSTANIYPLNEKVLIAVTEQTIPTETWVQNSQGLIQKIHSYTSAKQLLDAQINLPQKALQSKNDLLQYFYKNFPHGYSIYCNSSEQLPHQLAYAFSAALSRHIACPLQTPQFRREQAACLYDHNGIHQVFYIPKQDYHRAKIKHWQKTLLAFHLKETE